MHVITGGGSGIGKALAIALAAREQEVLIIGRRLSLLEETASSSPHIDYLCADISTDTGRALVYDAIKKKGKLKSLVNNAGILEPLALLDQIDSASFQQIMATNVEAPLFLIQALSPWLSGGRVLNVGSGAAHVPLIGMGAYCISKAALHMLTQCYQAEKPDNIAFACVMPGIIDTDMQGSLRVTESIDADNHIFYNALKTSNKLISPETVAAFLCWLLMEAPTALYVSKEWDIYATDHHNQWLKPPHTVPQWNEP